MSQQVSKVAWQKAASLCLYWRRGIWTTIWYTVPWTHASMRPKPAHDRFIRFCTTHRAPNTHTHTHTNTHSVHATRDIASDRRHLALCAGSAAQKSTNLKIARTRAVGSRLRTRPPQGWRGESVRYVISAAEVTWVRCLLVCRRRHRAMPLKLLHVR